MSQKAVDHYKGASDTGYFRESCIQSTQFKIKPRPLFSVKTSIHICGLQKTYSKVCIICMEQGT